MQSYSSKLYPEPDKRDAVKMKEFFNLKYKQRRFAQKEDISSSEDEDEDKPKKKKKKKSKKSPSPSSSSSSGGEETKKEVKATTKIGGKLMAPPSIGGKAKPPKETTHAAPEVMNFLEMDTAPTVAQQK